MQGELMRKESEVHYLSKTCLKKKENVKLQEQICTQESLTLTAAGFSW